MILPASNFAVPCYDELDAARIAQADLFHSPDIWILCECCGTGARSVTFAFAVSITLARERATAVWSPGCVDRNARRQGRLRTVGERNIQSRFDTQTRDRPHRVAHARSRPSLR